MDDLIAAARAAIGILEHTSDHHATDARLTLIAALEAILSASSGANQNDMSDGYREATLLDISSIARAALEARGGLDTLDAEIARRESPSYQWFPKPTDNQTPSARAGAAGARGMQHGELTGLKLARHILAVRLAADQEEGAT